MWIHPQKSVNVDKAVCQDNHRYNKGPGRKRPHSWLCLTLLLKTLCCSRASQPREERKLVIGTPGALPWSIALVSLPETRQPRMKLVQTECLGDICTRKKGEEKKGMKRAVKCRYANTSYVSLGESRKCMHHSGKR